MTRTERWETRPSLRSTRTVKIASCRFLLSAHEPGQEPTSAGPDVVFLGRSNVGKSSLINRLLGTRGMARTSSTPGRTQAVQFYRVNEAFHFVDLPGYGYAKAPKAVRERWGPMVEGFLGRRREQIVLALLIVDSRHAPSELDRTMRDWLVHKAIPYMVLGTKEDKLSGNGRARARRALQQAWDNDRAAAPPVMVSAKTGSGVSEIWRRLDAALAQPRNG